MNDDPVEKNLGEQQITGIIAEHKFAVGDLVSASTKNITFKMVSLDYKGRRLTPHVQAKELQCSKHRQWQDFSIRDLFSYWGLRHQSR